MRWGLVGLLGSLSSFAVAKPLPKGLAISLKNDALWATQNGVTVPLRGPDASVQTFADLKGAELSADGKTILVHALGCTNDVDTPLEVELAVVEARLENNGGMSLHLKKKYADAITHFAIAVKKDPDTAVYATNLLSAQSMGGKLDDADATITALAKTNPAWLGWRLGVDSDLVAVKARPSAKAALAAKPTQLTWKKLTVATNAQGLVATREWTFWGGPGAPSGDDLAIYDAAGKQLLRLPVVALADACNEMVPCTKAQDAHTAANTKIVNGVLGSLGFTDLAMTELSEQQDPGRKYTTPDKKLVIELDDKTSMIKLTRGKVTTSVKAPDETSEPKRVSIAGQLLVLQYREGFAPCDGDAQRSYTRFVRLK